MASISSPSKNQTAAERALAQEALSGRVCQKCGKDIKIKDLLTVKQVTMETRRRSIATYHRHCYSY